MTLSFAGRDINAISVFASNDLPDLLSPGYRQSPPSPEGHSRARPPYSPPPEEKPNLTGPIVKVALLVVVIGIVLWFVLPHPAAISSSYSKFATPDNILACDAPGGWSQVLAVKYQTPGDDTSPGGVAFDSGSTKIDISIGSLAHLMANEMLNSTTVIPMSLTEPLKTLQKRTEVKNVRGYSEKDSAALSAPIGSGLVSEWTAKGPFWGLPIKLHGYKASFVVCGRTVVVICKTTDSQWSTVKPVFDHVLGSVAAGTALQNEEQRVLNSLGLH